MPKPNTADAMKRFRAGKAGFTDKAHLKAKGLIPRADGTKKVSPKYEDLDKGDEKTIKPIIKQLKKSVIKHDKQAKTLEKDIADEKDLEEQVSDLENQIAEAKKELEEIRLNEEQAHVIRFKRIPISRIRSGGVDPSSPPAMTRVWRRKAAVVV